MGGHPGVNGWLTALTRADPRGHILAMFDGGSHAGKRARLAVLAMAALSFAYTPAAADDRRLTLTANSELSFGSFAVIGNGSRTVSASGAVTSRSILQAGRGGTGPARFTLTYDRGSNARRPVDVIVELVLIAPGRERDGRVTARLSAFDSDIAGHQRITPGVPVRLTIANCRGRSCTARFAIGARLDVSEGGSGTGGASLSIPLLMDAVVISDE